MSYSNTGYNGTMGYTKPLFYRAIPLALRIKDGTEYIPTSTKKIIHNAKTETGGWE
jgi:hypothetical protein